MERKIIISNSMKPSQVVDILPPAGGGWVVRFTSRPLAGKARSEIVTLSIRVPDHQGLIDGVIGLRLRAEDGPTETFGLPISGVIHGHSDRPPAREIR